MNKITIETLSRGKRYRICAHGQVITLSASDCAELLQLLLLRKDEFPVRDIGEPWLRDCPWCPIGTAHDVRYMDQHPNNPYRKRE